MRKIILSLFAFALLSCSEDVFTPSESSLVIEGYIESDGYPVVIVTRTMPVTTDEISVNEVKDYLVRWAKVSVINREDTVILTGMYDNGYFPPYIYTTSRLKGKVGESYELIVEYKDMCAHAKTTITSVPKVNEYKIEKCQDSDTLYQIKAVMTADDGHPNYYQFFSRVGGQQRQFLASFLGSFTDSVATGRFEIPIYRGHHLLNKDYSPYFSERDSVAVKCCHLDEYEYNFWKAYMESEYLSGAAMLSTSTNLPTNIIGGTGYWFGYGSTTSYFVVKDYIK